MSRKRSTACSACTSSSDEAVQLLRDLIQYGIVPPNTHAHAGLLCAAARAVDDGLRRESDPAQFRAYLPPAQRTARLLTWVGYVSALRSMPALSTTATKRLRLAPGRVPAAEQAASGASAEAVAKMVAPLRWKLWRSDDTTRAYDMTLDVSTGLPSSPCVWCLLPARHVGIGFTSAARAVHALSRLSLGNVAVADYTVEMGKALRGIDPLVDASIRPGYARVTLRTAASRDSVINAALGSTRTSALKGPFAACRGHGGFALCDVPPLASEGLAQLWLTPSDDGSLSSCHYDAPHGVLVVTGGSKLVALMPPAAVPTLGLPTMGDHKLVASYNAFDDDRFGPDGQWAGAMRVAKLTAGQALFIPHGWWHQVRSTPGCVGLSLAVCPGAVPSSPGE